MQLTGCNSCPRGRGNFSEPDVCSTMGGAWLVASVGGACTISFLRSSPSLRFGVVREGQYRALARASKLLVNASIDTLDQFLDACGPAPPLNTRQRRPIV